MYRFLLDESIQPIASRGTVVKRIAIHPYGARDPNYIVDLTLSNLLWAFSLLSSAHGSKVTRILLREEPDSLVLQPQNGAGQSESREMMLFDGDTMDSLWALTS